MTGHIWRVPLLAKATEQGAGEVVIDAYSTRIVSERTTSRAVLEARLRGGAASKDTTAGSRNGPLFDGTPTNTIICGDSEHVLAGLPAGRRSRVHLSTVLQCPPGIYRLRDLRGLPLQAAEGYSARASRPGRGTFFVINVSPVLIRRAHRNRSSRRIAVHLMSTICLTRGGTTSWMTSSGSAGGGRLGTGPGTDRQPLQYKPVPVTEYVLVYRKHTERLLDWNIRSHPTRRRSRFADRGRL